MDGGKDCEEIKMSDDAVRERAYQYAKLFRLTTTKKDYFVAVAAHVGIEFHQEANVAWETIDQWGWIQEQDKAY